MQVELNNFKLETNEFDRNFAIWLSHNLEIVQKLCV